MVDNVFEEIALSYRRNTEQQEEFCEKHNIPLIKILRTESVVCRMCESERIHEENQERVNELANAENERERKYYLEKFSLYDEVLKNATLDNFETPTEKEAEKLAFAKRICREWSEGARNNIVLQGEAGTGKSHLAFAMVKATRKRLLSSST
ncbi:DNA replication protein [Streptococcus pneumoniae]|nr:DNA replication protein [Streptococcus pneumoniae]